MHIDKGNKENSVGGWGAQDAMHGLAMTAGPSTAGSAAAMLGEAAAMAGGPGSEDGGGPSAVGHVLPLAYPLNVEMYGAGVGKLAPASHTQRARAGAGRGRGRGKYTQYVLYIYEH